VEEDRIVIDWQDVSMEGGCRWDWTLALYAILHPKEDVILYLARLTALPFGPGGNADDKHERVWRVSKMSWVSLSTASLLENSAYQVPFRLTWQLVADVEAFVDSPNQSHGPNTQCVKDQECLSARHRGLLPR